MRFNKKYLPLSLFLLLPFLFSAQTVIQQISKADTVFFTVTTSGCFNAGTTSYLLIKNKFKTRKVNCTKIKNEFCKKLSAKNYSAFIKHYADCSEQYKNASAENQTCTMSTEFSLSDKKKTLTFTNNNCKAEFNPEETLLKLIK